MFSEEHAQYVVNFIECLKHGDDFYGEPFDLLPWQRDAVVPFYGTLRDDGYRQYQFLSLEVPKKNGKSELAAALGDYHTFGDGARQGEVYICAADRSNAGIVFDAAFSMIEQCPALKKRTQPCISTRTIRDKVSGTKMKVMSAEAYSKHGYKPTCVIFDELEAQPDRRFWDVMTFASGSARKQPVWIVLQTAGDDPNRASIGWEIHKKARKILDFRRGAPGGYDNPLWLPFIYGMPDDPDKCKKINIYDEKVWFECNPSLGHTVTLETLRNEARDAKQSEAVERLFRWLRLNQWIAIKAVGWLPLTLYDKTEKTIPREILKGKRCFAGLDLSATTDLTALVLKFPPQDGLDFWYKIYFAWIPEEKMNERSLRDHVPFDEWVKSGYVTATPGDAVDYDYVEAEIIKTSMDYEITLLGTDPWSSHMLTQHLAKAGVKVYENPQTIAGMSPAMKAMEINIRSGKEYHEKNPCARWCFGNVRVHIDGNENMKPMKNRSIDRIDITVADINATAASMKETTPDINDAIEKGWTL
jgi:phage terminase large subunit-like protein